MNRRGTLVAILALGIAPATLVVQAQPKNRPFRIGLLPDLIPISRKQFVDALSNLGWIEGRDHVIVPSGFRRLGTEIEPAARHIVSLKPDAILVAGTSYAIAAQRLTSTIPIVMWASGYPVEAGVANSLARPGRNVTGNTAVAGTGIWGKLVQLLRDTKPTIKRVGVLWTYTPPLYVLEEIEPCHRELAEAARVMKLTVDIVTADGPDHLSAALARLDALRPDALLFTSDSRLYEARSLLMQFAVDRRLPTIAEFRWRTTEPQPLLSYAPPAADLLKGAAAYVHAIGKGANPAEMPIQLPSRFELEVNLKLAKALNIPIPQSILLRADALIE
ncbi:MAG: ABC transporter substrate-binding protein [Betaproteobacteria bacterium]|nr:ABC transporter substrate-binding protein [Betaproteobacteria bacterium]